MKHFGINLKKSKYSFSLVKDEFALINTKPSLPKYDFLAKLGAYTDGTGTEYTHEWCETYRILCLENYDLNMKYFNSLDEVDFNLQLTDYLGKYCVFEEVNDLTVCDGQSGYYLMVLDKYKQGYIGKSDDIKRRIQQHWNKTLSFDRVLFPMYDTQKSQFSIDFFRSLDTTRIFVWRAKLMDDVERELIDFFPYKYRLNRVRGDGTTPPH